ncbi:alpha/beta-hydrolase [Thozetella sp. PMI_491]|nr:alpha/beta-hydrolase [Thozetella sp. PMI_491]
MATLGFTLLLLVAIQCVAPWSPVAPSFAGAVGGHRLATVNLGYAEYVGTALGSGVNQFLGMRYARPPLRDLRWRAPQEPEDQTSSGQLPANQFGPLCIGTAQDSSSSAYSEDCLYINVFAPANATTTSKLPVWFFIQGGGYTANSNPNYNGTNVIVKSGYNMVVVNFNYRVGAFGFLASEKIRANGSLNVGLLDQRMALHWVQKNIHLFGGDPNHVVIHGASAGGGSVAYHLAAYGGRDDGLFVGAMPESPFFPTSRTVAESEFQFSRLSSQTGCAAASDELACLRGLSLSDIQKYNVISPFPGATGNPKFYFLPVIDGDFSREHMYAQFAKGKFVKVPTMVGGDSGEGDTFVPDASTQQAGNDFLVNNFPHLTAANLTAIDNAYPPAARLNHQAYFTQVSEAYGNSTFACGGLVISSAVSRYLGASHSWNYRYNVVEPSNAAKGIGVTHTSEIPAIFGVGFGGDPATSLGSTNADIVPIIMRYYISFVMKLDPNALKNETAPIFADFGNGRGSRLVLQLPLAETTMETVPDAENYGCTLWRSLAESITEQ